MKRNKRGQKLEGKGPLYESNQKGVREEGKNTTIFRMMDNRGSKKNAGRF